MGWGLGRVGCSIPEIDLEDKHHPFRQTSSFQNENSGDELETIIFARFFESVRLTPIFRKTETCRVKKKFKSPSYLCPGEAPSPLS